MKVFDVEWEQQGQQCCIKEISCPYFKIGDNHPEVCLFDKSIISNILDIPINKISHQDREEDLCTYTIDLADQK